MGSIGVASTLVGQLLTRGRACVRLSLVGDDGVMRGKCFFSCSYFYGKWSHNDCLVEINRCKKRLGTSRRTRPPRSFQTRCAKRTLPRRAPLERVPSIHPYSASPISHSVSGRARLSVMLGSCKQRSARFSFLFFFFFNSERYG